MLRVCIQQRQPIIPSVLHAGVTDTRTTHRTFESKANATHTEQNRNNGHATLANKGEYGMTADTHSYQDNAGKRYWKRLLSRSEHQGWNGRGDTPENLPDQRDKILQDLPTTLNTCSYDDHSYSRVWWKRCGH